MANTYTQLYIQFVFAVQSRQSLIKSEWKESLHKYMSGIVQKNGHKLIVINGVENHLHLFVGYKPHQLIPELMFNVKRSSSLWINQNHLVKGKFRWQERYGAFSYSHSHIDRVVRYISNQKEHHKKKSFTEEYLDLLKRYDMEYDGRYILKDV